MLQAPHSEVDEEQQQPDVAGVAEANEPTTAEKEEGDWRSRVVLGPGTAVCQLDQLGCRSG